MTNDKDLLQSGFRYALSLCNNRHDAEDLAQESWLRLYGHGMRPKRKGSYFIAIRNLFIDRYRHARLMMIEPFDDEVHPVPVTLLEDEAVILPHMDACLAQLRSLEREILFLHAVEGYSASEIAGLTGHARGTVLSLLHRTKLKLRRLLSPSQTEAGDLRSTAGE